MGLYRKMNSKEKKAQLRSHFRQLRARNNTEILQKNVLREVELELNRSVKLANRQGFIGLYWPLENEIDLKPLKALLDLQFALPAVTSKRMLKYYPWTISELKKDALNIPAPINKIALRPESMELLLIPALAIDQYGFRLGYGGGFFDRLRSNASWRSIPALAVLPKTCVSPQPLPSDSWDVPLNGWITEDGLSKATTHN